MNILKEIASWAKKRPSWLSDAIRRLLLQNELSEEDREDILLLLKAEKGIILPEGSTIKAKPVTDTEFSEPDVAARKVILKKLHSLKNVNALAPEQTIEFLKEGLTVIFGGNATGKSGYSRVLKRACRSREEQEQVLPNVFQVDSDSDETSRIPEATIEVLVDSETEELHWIGGEPSPEVLSEIAVFDSKCMRIIVDEENAVVYMPYGMDVFKKLADLFAFLRERLQQETKSLDKPFDIRSEFGETTEAGKLLSQISHSTDVSILAQLSDITEEDYKRIDELERRIAELKLSDPLKKAARFNRLVQRISLLIGDIIKISHAISDESVIKYRAQCKNTREAIEASALASKEAFRDEPLTGVGSEPWKMMFQAAKRYSESIAYPSQDFPVTGDDSRCVLCQQSLQGKAKERMERFRLFIEADLANKEAAERSKQEIMESEYKAVTADLHSKYSDLLDQVREEDEETYRKVLGYLTRVDSRVLFIGEAFKSGEWDKLEKDEPISPAVDLENLKERLTREISELEATSSTEERAKLENELNELRDRERLKKYKSKIEKHIEDIKQLHKLNLCIKETDTKEISIKGAQLTKEAITQELKDALESELREIGLDYLELELRPIGRRGATSHKIIFPSQDKKVNPSQVLSEGELCGVSIASFLAELEITSHECGIVLDDPVCSLDHQNREKIADRLVSEAMKRQVIVFTHDIAFLLALEESAYKNDVPFMCRTLIRAGDVVGICASERPWNSMSASERLRYIRGLFQDAASEHRKGNHEAYEENARKIYALMRETWERAVEDTLLNRTVERFRRGVETRRLEEVTVEEDDKRRIEQGMGKCSRWFRGHDQAAACDAPLPAPAELERDINELNDFISDITKRRERIRRKRAKV